MSNNIQDEELCDRFADLYPGAVTDVLDDRGYMDQTLDPAISPVRDHMTMAGIAYPCRGRPNRNVDEDENIRNILKMLRDTPDQSAIVYKSNAFDSSQLGELSMECLMARGCRGSVIDGGVRDLSYILDNDFPVFTKFRTPADAVPRWELLEWNTTVVVGGVEVQPGDVIVGDVDGVVAVPSKIAGDVLQEAEELADTENDVRTIVREGGDPVKAYEEYGVF